jgi:hypothetical protein
MTINERVERRLIGATQVGSAGDHSSVAARGLQGILAVEIAMRATWTLSVSRAPNRCYCAKQ